MANAYVEFVKKYAKDNNIKYGEALKKSKSAWKEHKAKNPTTSKKTKPKVKKTPMGKGGDIDMDIQQAKFQGVVSGGERRKLLRDYNKVLKEVENGLDVGSLSSAKFEEFKQLSITLSGGSKTNKYAKKLKKVEKEFGSKKYQKKADKKIKVGEKMSKTDIQKQALQKSTQIQLARDLGFKGARQQRAVNKTIFENRVRQLIRAGATRDEAEAIAKEEEIQRKENQTLEQQIALERIRQARGTSVLPKGKLATISAFTKNYAKDNNISFKQAQQQVKNKNLYKKYEFEYLKGTAKPLPSVISVGTSRISTGTTTPQKILERKKFLKRDGELKQIYKDKVDKYLRQYGKDNTIKKSNKPQSLFKILNTQKKTTQALKDLEELKVMPNIPAITRDRFVQLDGQVRDFNANYLDQFLRVKNQGLNLQQLGNPTLKVVSSSSGSSTGSATSTGTGATKLAPVPKKKAPPPPPARYKQINRGTAIEIGKLAKKKDLSKAITYARNKKITQFIYNGKTYRQLLGTGATAFEESKNIIIKKGPTTPPTPASPTSPSLSSASAFAKAQQLANPLGKTTEYPIYQEVEPDASVNPVLSLALQEIYDNIYETPKQRIDILSDIARRGIFEFRDSLNRVEDRINVSGEDADFIAELVDNIKNDNQVASGKGFSFSEADLEGAGLFDKLKKAFGKGDEGLGKVAEGVQDLKGNKARREKEIDEEDNIPLKMSDNVYYTGNDRMDNIGGYILNRSASNPEHAVYINEAEGKGIMVYRGSANLKDAFTDGHLAIGKLKNTQRFKDEVIWTRDILKLLPNYKWSVSGHSLGGTIANEMSNIFKIPAVSFNAGYGINMKQRNDLVKSYHARGDPASALGVGRMGESIIVDNNNKGGIASHSLDNFKTEKYYSKFENMRNLQSDMRTNELQNSIVADPTLEVNRFPNEKDYVAINQQQVAQEMGADNKDQVGGAFENLIDAQHKDLQKSVRDFKKDYSIGNIRKAVDSVNHLSGYKAIHNDFATKFGDLHKKLSFINSHIGRINDPNLRQAVNQSVLDTKYHLKNLKEENHAHIQKCIAMKFQRGLNNDNRQLTSQVILGKDHLGEKLGEDIKKKSQVGSFLKGATQPITNPDKEAVYRQYFPNANSKILGKGLTPLNVDNRGTYNLGEDKNSLLLTKLMNNASPKLLENLKAGALTSRDHREIKKITGMPINMLFKGGNFFSKAFGPPSRKSIQEAIMGKGGDIGIGKFESDQINRENNLNLKIV